MDLRFINYKKKRIKVSWENCGDCHAIFYPSTLELRINPKLSKLFCVTGVLFNL